MIPQSYHPRDSERFKLQTLNVSIGETLYKTVFGFWSLLGL